MTDDSANRYAFRIRYEFLREPEPSWGRDIRRTFPVLAGLHERIEEEGFENMGTQLLLMAMNERPGSPPYFKMKTGHIIARIFLGIYGKQNSPLYTDDVRSAEAVLNNGEKVWNEAVLELRKGIPDRLLSIPREEIDMMMREVRQEMDGLWKTFNELKWKALPSFRPDLSLPTLQEVLEFEAMEVANAATQTALEEEIDDRRRLLRNTAELFDEPPTLPPFSSLVAGLPDDESPDGMNVTNSVKRSRSESTDTAANEDEKRQRIDEC